MFKIDFTKLTAQLLPTFLRRPIMMAWLLVILTPLMAIYRLFINGREYDLFRSSIDSTIPRLEYMLNFIFYPVGLNSDYNNRIKIETVYSKAIIPIYLGGITQVANENRPLFILDAAPTYINALFETDGQGNDFFISVPPGAQPYDEERMRSLVQSYTLADKSFVIINL